MVASKVFPIIYTSRQVLGDPEVGLRNKAKSAYLAYLKENKVRVRGIRYNSRLLEDAGGFVVDWSGRDEELLLVSEIPFEFKKKKYFVAIVDEDYMLSN